MYTDDGQIDGSWTLRVHVIDVNEDVPLRVTGEKSIGSVMYLLVEKINTKLNWSDHGLWWPARSKWLLQTRATLDQFGVQSDARLLFVRMHNMVRVRLPDLQVREMRVNFAKKVFGVVVQLCHELGVRHPEELSLARPFSLDDLKAERIPAIEPLSIQCVGTPASPRPHPNGSTATGASPSPLLQTQASRLSNGPLFAPHTPITPSSPHFLTVSHSPQTLSRSGQANGGSSHTLMPASINSLRFEGVEESLLANSPYIGTEEAIAARRLVRLKTPAQRARIHGAWLDSSRSLMEQGVVPNEGTLIALRFKFYNFYDLNPKYDAIRINQLYEQGRWSLISEETECNEEEMIVFAALQLQVHLQTTAELEGKSPSVSSSPNSPKSPAERKSGVDAADGKPSPGEPGIAEEEEEEDEIDSALAELQLQLEGGDLTSTAKKPHSPMRSPGARDSTDNAKQSNDEVLDVPQLSDYLKYFKPKKFSIKNYKRMWVTLRETSLNIYRYHQDVSGPPLESYQLQRCEIQTDVNVTTKKYGLRVFVAGGDHMLEIWLRCQSKEQYAQWMAACRLASAGKTLASRALFDSEKESTLSFLDMQTPSPQPVLTHESMPHIDAADYVSRSVLKKIKGKALLHRIAEAHSKIRTMSNLEAKLQFIRNWKQLSSYGVTRFVVRFQNAKKDEIFGVTDTRLVRLDAATGDLVKAWRLKDIQAWNVNWNTENVILNFNGEKVVFHPLSADCKTVHEFVGGYVFMNMRSPEKSQDLNETFFHKLTGGNLTG